MLTMFLVLLMSYWFISGGRLNFRLFGREILNLSLSGRSDDTRLLPAGDDPDDEDGDERPTIRERLSTAGLLTEERAPRIEMVGKLYLSEPDATPCQGCDETLCLISEHVRSPSGTSGTVDRVLRSPIAEVCDSCGQVGLLDGGGWGGPVSKLVTVGANFHDVIDVLEGKTAPGNSVDADLDEQERKAEQDLATVRMRRLRRTNERAEGHAYRDANGTKTPPTAS